MAAPANQITLLDHRGNPMVSDTAHFAASRTAREMKSWQTMLQSGASELDGGEHETIAARSSDLVRNHGIASGLVRTNIDNIVGTGLRLVAMPDYRALKRSKAWADAWARDTEAQFRTFAESVDFSADRQTNFGGSVVAALRNAMVLGDAFGMGLWFDQRERPGAKWSTVIQTIAPPRVCNPNGGGMNTAARFEGIERNAYGEAIGYHVRTTHPSDGLYIPGASSQRWEYVPARTKSGRIKMVHLFQRSESDSPRGKSIFTSVMAAFRMLDHYQRMELQTAVVHSMIAAFVETPLSTEAIADLFGTGKQYVDAKKGYNVRLEGAAVIPLYPGEKLNAFTPTRPNSSYAAFVDAVLRYISTGLNVPYELLMKDFSKTNYSSARAALLEAWRYFMAMRKWIAEGWCSPIYEMWLEEAVMRGLVEAPDFYLERAAYCRARWIGPGRGWIDPLKEAQAAGERMKTTTTLEYESAEQGADWEEVLEQKMVERDRYIAAGLPDPYAPPPQGGAPGFGGGGAPAGPGDDSTDEETDADDGDEALAEARAEAAGAQANAADGWRAVAEMREAMAQSGAEIVRLGTEVAQLLAENSKLKARDD